MTASILFGMIWLVFVFLFAAFWSRNFDLFQNIMIFVASLVILFGALGILWAAWGMRFMR